MPIITRCQGCNRPLRVADEFAGQKARCPICRTTYFVPEAAGETRGASEAQSASHNAPAGASGWMVRTPEGQVFGPIERTILERWVREGRVTSACEVRRSDEQAWQGASRVFRNVDQGPFSDSPAANPARRTASSAQIPPPADVAAHQYGRGGGVQAPHRGGVVLALSIVGFVIACPILSLIAWMMGASDLRAMRYGEMDPAGHGLTQAGYILGMIHCLLWLLGIVVGVLGSLA